MNRDWQKFGLFRNAADTVVHPPHTAVFREGDDGRVMYAIKRGRVQVLCDGKPVDSLGEGEVFGEMALLQHLTRSATVVTLEETELVTIGEPEFNLLVRQNPHFALQLLRVLSDRLRHSHALNRVEEQEA